MGRARRTDAALGAAAVVLAFEAAACGGQLDVQDKQADAGTAASGSGGTSGGAAGGVAGANPSCANDVVDGDETDLDCGGACPPCDVNHSCVVDSDCYEEVCDTGTCSPMTCYDAELNGREADVDCGGPVCAPCAAGTPCERSQDCDSLLCRAGVCSEAACDDNVLNGSETGTDCGGEDCEPCAEQCNCAESERLSVVNCGSTTLQDAAWPTPGLLSADGSVFVFTRCVDPISQADSCPEFDVVRQSGERALQSLAWGIAPEVMTPDGQHLVMTDYERQFLFTADSSNALEFSGRPVAISDDGEVLAVTRYPEAEAKAGRWTSGTGFEELGDIPDGTGVSHAVDMSADGSVIVGYAERGTDEVPFVWRAGVLETFTSLPGDASSARPLRVSDDGSTVVGVTGDLSSGAFQPIDMFQLTEAEGFTVIAPVCKPDCAERLTLRVSEDGSVIAGTLALDGVDTAFRWTESEGVVRLMNTVGPYPSTVHDMSMDGTVVVGRMDGTPEFARAYVWNETLGMAELGGLLGLYDVDTSGWEFSSGEIQVSADGNVVVGIGSCGGTRALYRAVLSED